MSPTPLSSGTRIWHLRDSSMRRLKKLPILINLRLKKLPISKKGWTLWSRKQCNWCLAWNTVLFPPCCNCHVGKRNIGSICYQFTDECKTCEGQPQKGFHTPSPMRCSTPLIDSQSPSLLVSSSSSGPQYERTFIPSSMPNLREEFSSCRFHPIMNSFLLMDRQSILLMPHETWLELFWSTFKLRPLVS